MEVSLCVEGRHKRPFYVAINAYFLVKLKCRWVEAHHNAIDRIRIMIILLTCYIIFEVVTPVRVCDVCVECIPADGSYDYIIRPCSNDFAVINTVVHCC